MPVRLPFARRAILSDSAVLLQVFQVYGNDLLHGLPARGAKGQALLHAGFHGNGFVNIRFKGRAEALEVLLGQLPDAPKAPETLPGLATAKADFSDSSFTANGYVNAAPAGAMPVKEGESGIPSTVWSEVTNSYVLSLGTPDYWIPTGDEILDPNGYGFDETGGLNQKYLAVMYDGPVVPNLKAELSG